MLVEVVLAVKHPDNHDKCDIELKDCVKYLDVKVHQSLLRNNQISDQIEKYL